MTSSHTQPFFTILSSVHQLVRLLVAASDDRTRAITFTYHLFCLLGEYSLSDCLVAASNDRTRATISFLIFCTAFLENSAYPTVRRGKQRPHPSDHFFLLSSVLAAFLENTACPTVRRGKRRPHSSDHFYISHVLPSWRIQLIRLSCGGKQRPHPSDHFFSYCLAIALLDCKVLGPAPVASL
jgi:hypothetical protein